ncbi:MAG: chemotaxis protein CheW [Reichenbachiella sp.]|uniref:chemotaxis protein CheW n=1 Tax=Reichenbachiella sp. TaxID=2184521 RepID=UPI003266AA7F
MALGKNVKKDKLIPSKPGKEQPTAKSKAGKKATPKPAKPKAKSKTPIQTKKVTKKAAKPVEVASAPPVQLEPIHAQETKPQDQVAKEGQVPYPIAKRVLPANYLTPEEMENRQQLKAKYDQEIQQLKGQSVQLIVFVLGGERYALEIDKVKEIVPKPETSKLPRAPEYIKGVANIRGSVMVIMDLENKFELFKPEEINEKNFALIIKSDRFKAGILVAEVPTTLKIQGDVIESSSQIMSNTVLDETFIKGLIKQEDGMIILLDIIELIESDEIRVIAESVTDSQ